MEDSPSGRRDETADVIVLVATQAASHLPGAEWIVSGGSVS